MQEINISQQQSRQFARAIYHDISKYLSEHQEEYELWLKKQQQEESETNKIIREVNNYERASLTEK